MKRLIKFNNALLKFSGRVECLTGGIKRTSVLYRVSSLRFVFESAAFTHIFI